MTCFYQTRPMWYWEEPFAKSPLEMPCWPGMEVYQTFGHDRYTAYQMSGMFIFAEPESSSD